MIGPRPADWIPEGWTPASWRQECRRMADVCRSVRPDMAAEWDERGNAIERRMQQELGNCCTPGTAMLRRG